ncbi:MAG: GNAT family N-acetyltransferase [Alphaproteobacteria bacterium]|nr:GNAT family N-acetyltransferase [Alphaproteobacteria bacterium]
MISIRPADLTDIDFLKGLELAPNEAKLKEILQGGNIQIAVADHTSVGFLSFSILWGTLPFLEFIEIPVSLRGRKFGARSVRAWEQEMKSRGFDLVLTSTNADGDAQHFWRKMGYVDCGALTVRGKAAEIFFQRLL